jgi:hypothetical protein
VCVSDDGTRIFQKKGESFQGVQGVKKLKVEREAVNVLRTIKGRRRGGLLSGITMGMKVFIG